MSEDQVSRQTTIGLMFLLLAGCRQAGKVSLSLQLQLGDQCQPGVTGDGNPPPPTSCDAMTLDCADRVLFRIRENKAGGDILRSRCLDVRDFGSPRTLCELMTLAQPVSLVRDLPQGQTVVFELRALRLLDETAGCDPVDPAPQPNVVFSGYSPPVLLDGQDRDVVVRLSRCYSCPPRDTDMGSFPPSDGSAASPDLGTVPTSDQGAASPDMGVGPAPDQGAAADLSVRADLSAPPGDLGSPPDAHASDLSSPHDLAIVTDLSSPHDLAIFSDLSSQRDLAIVPDLTFSPDLAGACGPGYFESPYWTKGGARCCPSSIDRSQCKAPGAPCPDGTHAQLPPGGCCAVCD